MSLSTVRILAAGAVAAAVVALGVPAGAATASEATSLATGRWTSTWSASLHHPTPSNDWQGSNWSVPGFTDQSVRQVVRVSTGGSQVRIRLSNRYGAAPLRVTGATVAKAATGAAVRPGTVRQLTFDRSRSTTIPVGQETTSDAATIPVGPLDSLAVTLYFAGSTGPATFHELALATTYRAQGDRRFDPSASAFAGETSHSWYYLTGVDVAGRTGGWAGRHGSVVALGDSVTEGYGSTVDANNRYPDQLAERLVRSGRPMGVVNAGIGGNKLLGDSTCFGASAVDRFANDVLAQPDVRTVIVLEGVNDIGTGGMPDYLGCGASPTVTAAQLIDAHRGLIRAAHGRGVRIVGATLTPFKGSFYAPAEEWEAAEKAGSVPAAERVRDAVNTWIRTSGEYDAVADFDWALADPADPDAMRAAYDGGDQLHPNDAGMDAMANAIDLGRL
ncbi:SGNH/GDSL hydrolase family protein [Actinopolymorpha pittospori]|uniref:Lysophospholipase L1-like esterase n=1 Tax=Actinopolymorpha pittospori TaxID=648752 RepID=A0A927NB46_9ACTN|nr:SGNH/GDSL hydrolase family protein [Actinopolymorpha pittospori]MBE1612267.1 lysophospholipase L1-like esterase [Actinopolymorpha pittospori]